MNDKPTTSKSTDWLTNGLAIRAMMGVGAITAAIVLISAAISPPMGAATRSAADPIAVPGYEAAFPPRPIPPMLVQDGDRQRRLATLPGTLNVVMFLPTRCEGCAEASAGLEAMATSLTDSSVGFARVYLDRGAYPLQPSSQVADLIDTSGAYEDYIGRRERRPVAVIYRPGDGEVGRITGDAAWQQTETESFLRALAQ